MAEVEEVREQIIEAAYARIREAGYAKTSMAGLAKDCCMSPGNLYRYFKGKLDIGEAISLKSSDRVLMKLREVARDLKRPARDRLHDFLQTEMHMSFAELDGQPHIVEMAEFIVHQKPEIRVLMLKQSRSVLTEILSQGNSSGEFDIDDVVKTAGLIQVATMKFRYPQLFSNLGIEELETELEGVYEIVACGISSR